MGERLVWGCTCPEQSSYSCPDLNARDQEPPLQRPLGLHQASGPFNLSMLPAELRLRILRHTHLGPPETGGYKEHYTELFICNGKLAKGVYSTFEKELFLWFVYFL